MGLIADIRSDMEKGAVRLISEYRLRLVSDAKRLCENESDVEDLVSRTLVKVISNIDSHDATCDFYAWMKSIMENIHRNDARRPVDRRTQAVPPEELEQYAGVDWGTDEQLLKNSDSEAIRQAIAELDPKYNQMMLMRYYDGLSLKEIANCLTMPMGTVSRRVQIAHRLLAGKLRAEFGKAKKPLAILLAVLLGIGSLFGAWQAGLLEPLLSPSGEADKSGEAESFPLHGETLQSGDAATSSGEAESLPLHGGTVSTQLQSQSETDLTQEESQSETTKEQTMNAKKLMVAAAVGASALGAMANVIYVAPDGAGSGASWADPAPITTAIAAAVAAEGGEVWLKEGTYRMSGAVGLTACSNLVVRGGFAGDETSADAADPKAHPTILSGEGSGCGWTVDGERPAADSENFVPLWKDGEFIVARADDVVATYRNPYTTSRTSGLKAPFISSAVPVTGLKIVGITFTANICSPAIDLPEGSDFEIDGCRFLACGCDTGAIGNGALSTAGRVTMRNTDVIGCPCPIFLTGTAADATNRIINCRFEDNTGLFKELSGGAITAKGGQPLEVSGCTFLRNTGFTQGNGSSTYPAAAISCRDGALTLTDSVFEGNRVRNAGNAPYATVAFKNATIARCLFKGNTLLSVAHQANSLDIYSAGICHNGDNMLVRDTVFAGNTCTVQTDYTRTGISWTSAVAANSECGQFYNCSFYGNRTEVVVTNDSLVGTHLGATVKALRKIGKDAGLGLAFVNCLFSDNELAGNVSNMGEIAVDNSDKSQFTLALINSVIWNEQADYPAFYTGANFPVNISHSDVVGYAGAPGTNGNNYVEYATAVDPKIAEKPVRARGSYPFKGMLGLSKTSAFAKCARPIYESEGVLYFYAPGMVSGSPWRKCTSRGTNLAELDAGDPLPDAFGAARTEGAICYGPALTDPLGLLLMLK